jgi:Gpi18-like mannosyltransferase
MFLPFFIIGVILRLLLIPVPGFKADMAFWKGWGLAVADKGFVFLFQNTNFNYPPGFAYVLFILQKVYSFFASPYSESFWSSNNLLYLSLFKLILIAFDILIVVLIVKIGEELGKRKLGLILGLLYFFSPLVLFDGVLWGQVDQLGIGLFLLSFYFLLKEKFNLASLVFVLSFLIKLQNIIFIPLFYLFLFKRLFLFKKTFLLRKETLSKKYSWKDFVDCLKYSLITFLIVLVPFILAKEVDEVINLIMANADWFPWYSLNAYNFWWLLSGFKGMSLSDKNLFFGIVDARSFSLILFSFVYFIGFLKLFLSKKENLLKNFLLSLSLAVLAFFHCLTQAHERYLFPLVVLFLVLFFFKGKESFKKLLIFYFLFSLGFFINLYLSMHYHYAELVFWPFSPGFTNFITVLVSLLQIGLFIYFLFTLILKGFRKSELKLVLAGFTVFIVILIFKNLAFWLGKPISLTNLKPISYHQDYLKPNFSKPVEAQLDPFSWGRLSANYFFYKQGIGSHANSEIVYSLKGKFSSFKTDFALDTQAGVEAGAFFIIEGDGKMLFKSEEKDKFSLPETVKLDIAGVDRLVLKIESNKQSINGCHADWLNPVLTK